MPARNMVVSTSAASAVPPRACGSCAGAVGGVVGLGWTRRRGAAAAGCEEAKAAANLVHGVGGRVEFGPHEKEVLHKVCDALRTGSAAQA